MKIYTKTGDKGTTMLFGGGRVPKHHIRIEAYGTVDELNSFIGLVKDQVEDVSTQSILKQIQDALFTLGSILACDPQKGQAYRADFSEEEIVTLEKAIDQMQEKLPKLKNFILPGGYTPASFCHIARCVCRRAERRTTHLFELEPETVPEVLIKYLNRLSDFLFVLSRMLVFEAGKDEILWKSEN